MLSNLTRSARRLVPVCVLSTAAVAALAAPGVANATAVRLPHCTEGTPINGEGSTLQEPAMQKVWAPAYNSATNTNKAACPGGPAVTYNIHGKTGSGPGMENWYKLDEFGPTDQGFVGTDNPPTSSIKTEIENQQEAGGTGKVLTIPTLQAAVALIVHLPAGCTVSSEPQPGLKVGRLLLSQKRVEEIFRRQVVKWNTLKANSGKNNVLSGTKCKAAQKESEIPRVARLEGSGTTATFKKWLELVNGKAEAVVNGKTWLESGEETPGVENTEWPEETTKMLRGKGSGGVIEEVEKTPGSIGYVNLANARAGKGKGLGFVPPKGGEGTEEFWAELENKQTSTIEGVAYKLYTDPSTDGPAEAKADANCVETTYVAINPETGKTEAGKFPPPSTESTWNLVSAEAKQKNYSLCGFTYDLSLTHYAPFANHGADEAEATTAGNYLEWVLNTEAEGGQALIAANQDYLGLPTNIAPKKNVLKIAQEGAKKISY
jgi:ABC-type phosphate transport system substrate-binding protein